MQVGYTHASYYYTDKVIEDVTSYDFTSSYPYVMLTEKYPSSEFKKCNIKTFENLSDNMCYLINVTFFNIKSMYYNNFISQSKCSEISKGRYDNGRVISADYLIITITDVDLDYIRKSYKFESYIINDIYYSFKAYLPCTFINFILDKYVEKTQYKNLKGYETEYIKSKNRFNSLYGMSVTQTIRDEVEYINKTMEFIEKPLTNEEIIKKLNEEKRKCFMSFSWGVWVTAYARRNLIENIIKLDKYVIYSDTDSLKMIKGFDQKVIDDYNLGCIDKIKAVCEYYDLDYDRFRPKDKEGIEHLIGVFDLDGKYKKFITQR